MSARSMPPAIVATTVALAVAAGPLAAAAYGDDGNGNGNNGTGYSTWGTGQPTKDPVKDDPKGPKNDPKGPKGPQQGPGDELDGSYDGAVVTTQLDTSKQADRAAADGVRDAVPVRRGVDRHHAVQPQPQRALHRLQPRPTTSPTRSSRPLPAWSPRR